MTIQWCSEGTSTEEPRTLSNEDDFVV